jgi:hypothetical protein
MRKYNETGEGKSSDVWKNMGATGHLVCLHNFVEVIMLLACYTATAAFTRASAALDTLNMCF